MIDHKFGVPITEDETYGFPRMRSNMLVIATITGDGSAAATLSMVLDGTDVVPYTDSLGDVLTQADPGAAHRVYLPASGRLALVVSGLVAPQTVKLAAGPAVVPKD